MRIKGRSTYFGGPGIMSLLGLGAKASGTSGCRAQTLASFLSKKSLQKAQRRAQEQYNGDPASPKLPSFL